MFNELVIRNEKTSYKFINRNGFVSCVRSNGQLMHLGMYEHSINDVRPSEIFDISLATPEFKVLKWAINHFGSELPEGYSIVIK